MRWRLLDDEEDEIRRIMDEEKNAGGEGGGQREEELSVALGKVVARRSMPPRLRGLADGGAEAAKAVLPAYADSRMTVPVELVANGK